MDATGRSRPGKSPTTPDDRSRGFFDSIERAADVLGDRPGTLLASCSRLVHGTTTGTNAIVERRGARVGLLATRGHDDAIFVMKGTGPHRRPVQRAGSGRPGDLQARAAHPAPSSSARSPSASTSTATWSSRSTRTRCAARCGIWSARARRRSPIVFLWSTVNPAHERRARRSRTRSRRLCSSRCSSDLSAKVGEYERTMTAVMNSYIGPLMVEYVDRIQDGAARARLRRDGAVRAVRGRGDHERRGAARRRSGTVQSGSRGRHASPRRRWRAWPGSRTSWPSTWAAPRST